MLTQKNTKYSYARRILALPILFGVSFALLVNAKNIEIKKQNKAIEIAVQELKKDTVKEKDVQKLLEAQQAKINKASEKIKKENEKIATLSEQTRKKSEELQKIAKEKGADSYDYELKAKELENLGNEIDRIANSEAYQNNWKEFEFNFNEMEKFFNVEDFKNKFKLNEEKMKELEKKFNSKEFKDKIIRIQKVRTPQMMDVEVPAPITPPISIEKLKNSPNSNLTKEEIKKLDKLSKERAELSKKQAEIAKKQAELAKQQAEQGKKQAEIAKQQAEISRKYAQNNPWIITVDANVPKHGVVSVSADKIKYNLATKNSEVEGLKSMKVISDKSIKYYINGKLSTKEEMDKLNPNDIATVNVNKNVNNGKEEGEIRIQTK